MRNAAAVWLACLALAACGGGEESPPPTGATLGALRVVNGTSRVVDVVYVEPAPAELFAHARNAAPLAPGEALVVPALAPGTWELLVVVAGPEASFMSLDTGVTVVAGETRERALSDGHFGGRLRVTNGGAVDLTAVDVAGYPWSRPPLAPGASLLVPAHFPAGTFPFTCEFAGGGTSTGSLTFAPFVVTAITCE